MSRVLMPAFVGVITLAVAASGFTIVGPALAGPFDRLIVAQAIMEQLTVVSRDHMLKRYKGMDPNP